MDTHQPVLLDSTLELLDPQIGETYLDGTAGFGGHARAVAAKVGAGGRLILVDRDSRAIAQLEQEFGDSAQLIRGSYASAFERLWQEGELVDMILLDLGVSSPQIDNPQRGFSFLASGPLDMRMDQSQRLTAAEVVNDYSQAQLKQILRQYGEEPRAAQIAVGIVKARPIKDTAQLAEVVAKAAKYYGSRTHPATRSFQAIRMEVNQELEQLKSALPLAVKLLRTGGRLVVISFHSLEDRIVKQFIDLESRDCICPPGQPICTCSHQPHLIKLTRGVVKGQVIDSQNPRARSAKLRAARKI